VWRSYDGLVIDPHDYVGNVERVSEFEFNRIMNRLGKPVDRTEWFTPPQTVNAFYHPGMNEIVFPAGVLQPPFFDVAADDSVNYAAIGSFIGHEMTHGFDDQGSKFDAKGNLNDWWTTEDRKHFDERTGVLVEQFNQFEVDGGIKVNGKLTLGENIADLGGILIAFDAYKARLERTGRTDIDGFTPEQRFFLTIAQNERELENPESIKTSTLNDPHSPAKFRVNGPLPHVQEFYDAFGITETDPMYIPKEKRAHIW
jgi:putative endopeptidase